MKTVDQLSKPASPFSFSFLSLSLSMKVRLLLLVVCSFFLGLSLGLSPETKPVDPSNPLILRHFRLCKINVNVNVDRKYFKAITGGRYWDGWFTVTLLKTHPLSCGEIKKEFCAYLRDIGANGFYCDSSWYESNDRRAAPLTAKKPGVWAHGFGQHMFFKTKGKGPNLRLYGDKLLPQAFGYLKDYMGLLGEAYPDYTMPSIPQMTPPAAPENLPRFKWWHILLICMASIVGAVLLSCFVYGLCLHFQKNY